MLLLGFPSQRPVHRVRESGNERCVCLHPQMKYCLSRVCIWADLCARGCLSMATCESVCAHLPTQYPVLWDFIHWLPYLEMDSSISSYFLLCKLANCCSRARLAHCYTYGSSFSGLDCGALCISSLVLSAAICTYCVKALYDFDLVL